MRLLAITLSAPMASLALAMPSQAAGVLPFKGVAPVGSVVTLQGIFTLIAHPVEFGRDSKEFTLEERGGSEGLFSLEMDLGENEKHGTTSSHTASVNLIYNPMFQRYNWEIDASAEIKENCKPVKGCEQVRASTKALFVYNGVKQGEKYDTKISKKGARIPPESPGNKDPKVTLFLDEQAFFTADIFATMSQGPGLEPTLHADFSFGTLAPGYGLNLSHGGFSCELANCSSDTSFLNSLQSIVSTGPGGNWSLDPDLQVFTPNNDIAIPNFSYTNSLDKGATGTFGISSEGSDPGVERVPGPLPILGLGAAFGFSRKLRKRIKSSKPELISTTAV